jgi:hypothetical protein
MEEKCRATITNIPLKKLFCSRPGRTSWQSCVEGEVAIHKIPHVPADNAATKHDRDGDERLRVKAFNVRG